MRYSPVLFRVLIEMDVIEREITEGAMKGFQLQSNNEHEREKGGNCVGKVIALGPTAFIGYAGCKEDSAPKCAGVKIGDKVEFARYDGKESIVDKERKYRLINDIDILMVINDE